MTEEEIYWRQAFRLQAEITLRLSRSLMACSEDKVNIMAYHIKEKTANMIEMHDEFYPYDKKEVLG